MRTDPILGATQAPEPTITRTLFPNTRLALFSLSLASNSVTSGKKLSLGKADQPARGLAWGKGRYGHDRVSSGVADEDHSGSPGRIR